MNKKCSLYFSRLRTQKKTILLLEDKKNHVHMRLENSFMNLNCYCRSNELGLKKTTTYVVITLTRLLTSK